MKKLLPLGWLLLCGCAPALVAKAQKGDVAELRALLAKPMPQELKDEALIEAVQARRAEAVILLLKHGAAANALKSGGISVLSLAIEVNDPDSVKFLLEHGADLKSAVGSYRHAKLRVASLLLDHGADPNAKDSNGATPLVYAACDGHAELVKLWLGAGADPASAGMACQNSRFDEDKVMMVCDLTATAVDCARAKGYADIVKMLKARSRPEAERPWRPSEGR